VVDYVCDPRTGLPRTLKFLPTVAEVVEACEARVKMRQSLDDLRKRAERERATLNDPNASADDKRRARGWLEMTRMLHESMK